MNQLQIRRQERVESILSSLSDLDYLTRSQLQQIHDLKGERNANRFLKSMGDYVSYFRNGLEKVYYLNATGRDYIGEGRVRKRTSQVDHFLLRNQLFIELGQPPSWEKEVRIKAGDLSLVCDARYHDNGRWCFVEVDCQQSMKRNRGKVDKYRKIREATRENFKIVWITEMESRRQKLARLCAGMPFRVYTAQDVR